MQSRVFLFVGILYFVALCLYYFNNAQKTINLNLVELKTFENFEVATSSKENVALYKKEFTDKVGKKQELYVALGEMKSDAAILREGLQKLHTNIFWDPNRCAQMLNIIGHNAIIFSDTFKDVEGKGFTAFVYKYDIQQNTLVGYKVFVSVQKLFTDGNQFYGISKRDQTWTLYKINFEDKKLEAVKTYTHNLQLITAGDELRWCDGSSDNCIVEKDFAFTHQDSDLKLDMDPENLLNLKVFYEGSKVLALSKEDRIGYYILGIRSK